MALDRKIAYINLSTGEIETKPIPLELPCGNDQGVIRSQWVAALFCMVVQQVCVHSPAAEEFLAQLQGDGFCFDFPGGEVDIGDFPVQCHLTCLLFLLFARLLLFPVPRAFPGPVSDLQPKPVRGCAAAWG